MQDNRLATTARLLSCLDLATLFPGVERKSGSISLKEKSPFVFSFVFFTVQILVKIKNLWCKIMAA